MAERVMGLDLGIRARSVCVVLDEQGERIVDGVSFGLDIEELARLERSALEGTPSGTKLHVVMEKTYPTYEYVSQFFLGREHRVSFAKPEQVKAARKVLSPKVKNDREDAHTSAKLPEIDHRQLQRCYVAPVSVQRLKTLVSQRASSVKRMTSLKNRLNREVSALWPGLNEVFDSLDSGHARAFLRELNPDKVVSLQEQGLADFLRQNGRIGQPVAQRLASQLFALAERVQKLHRLMDEKWVELRHGYAMELLDELEFVERRVKAKEEQINEAYIETDGNEYLLSVPGVGKKTAPSVLAHLGEPERFATSRNAQGFVGLYPETDASGKSDRKGTKVAKAGPSQLKRDLVLIADHFRRHDPQGAKLYYEQMVHRGKHHNSALCVVANRLVIQRILAVLKEKRSYVLRDLEGQAISKEEARKLVEKFRVPESERERLRSRKRARTKKKNRGSESSVTSELEAPRNDTVPRLDEITSERLSVTKDQLAMLVFRNVERLLKSGEDVEEIRLHLAEAADKFFQKRA